MLLSRSGSASSSCLRSQLKASIVGTAIVVFLSVLADLEDDTVVLRVPGLGPLPDLRTALVHHCLGLYSVPET